MAKNRDLEFKEFIIATRKEIGPGVTTAPVWVMQKANKRVWNKHAKRHWRNVDMGAKFAKMKLKKKRGKKERKGKKKA